MALTLYNMKHSELEIADFMKGHFSHNTVNEKMLCRVHNLKIDHLMN